MAKYKTPFSGDVTQAFKILTQNFSSVGSQFGFINIYNSKSSAPEVEEDVLEEVGGYGKQLGRMGDALAVLIARLPAEPALTHDEQMAIAKLTVMLDDINAIKERHGRKALRIA